MVDITIHIFFFNLLTIIIKDKLQCDYYNNTVHSKKVGCWPINTKFNIILIANIIRESKMFFFV